MNEEWQFTRKVWHDQIINPNKEKKQTLFFVLLKEFQKEGIKRKLARENCTFGLFLVAIVVVWKCYFEALIISLFLT